MPACKESNCFKSRVVSAVDVSAALSRRDALTSRINDVMLARSSVDGGIVFRGDVTCCHAYVMMFDGRCAELDVTASLLMHSLELLL